MLVVKSISPSRPSRSLYSPSVVLDVMTSPGPHPHAVLDLGAAVDDRGRRRRGEPEGLLGADERTGGAGRDTGVGLGLREPRERVEVLRRHDPAVHGGGGVLGVPEQLRRRLRVVDRDRPLADVGVGDRERRGAAQLEPDQVEHLRGDVRVRHDARSLGTRPRRSATWSVHREPAQYRSRVHRAGRNLQLVPACDGYHLSMSTLTAKQRAQPPTEGLRPAREGTHGEGTEGNRELPDPRPGPRDQCDTQGVA